MIAIYGLFDAAGRLRYVGKTSTPGTRLAKHMRDAQRLRRTPLHLWLVRNGPPELRILEADPLDWREAERRHIAQAREREDPILNLSAGGNEPVCSEATRSSNARRMNDALRDPLTSRIQRYKRALNDARRRGQLPESAKVLMRQAAAKAPQLFGAWAWL